MSLVCVSDFEKKAESSLSKQAWDYYRSGADEEITLKKNVFDFRRIKIIPRFLTNVSKIDISLKFSLPLPPSSSPKRETTSFQLSSPILIAATAMQKMAHPLGEIGTYKAAGNEQTLMTLSSLSTTSMEDISEAGNSEKWFQLYVTKNRDITRELLNKAKRLNFSAVVLTIDTPYLGVRRNDLKNSFTLPPNCDLEVLKGLPLVQSPGQSALECFASNFIDPSLTWKDIEWIVSESKLPVLVKGVLSPEDALLSLQHGVSGIVVSNHGARQLDTVPSTIEVLPHIVRVVQDYNLRHGVDVPVFLDGGVRTGTDVLKALAFGAKGVFIGRPILWGLAVGGQNGVEKILSILKKELSLAMALSGCRSLSDISSQLIWRTKSYL